MKKIVTRALAVAIAFTTMVSMSGIMTVNAEAAAKKSNVTVNFTKNKKKADVKSLAATVDGKAVKNNKTVKVYLSGKNGKVKLDTTVTVNVKGKKLTKKAEAKFAKVTYSSSNKSVATVSKKGVITIKKTGKATITIKSNANKKKAIKFTLNVKKGVKSMTIKKADKTVNLKVDQTYEIKPTVKTVKGVKKTITAKSSDKKIAKVKVKDGKVTITAVAPGEADVTIAPKYGSDKAVVVKVTVAAKEYKTKVVFADVNAKEVKLVGTLSWKDQKDLAKAVKEFAAALGGDYTLTVNGKEAKVVKGVVDEADLAKIPATGEKKDVTIKADITIADALKLAGAVDEKAAVEFKGEFTMGGVKVSGISLANKVVSFKLGDLEMKAYVEGGDLYLDGDQSKLLETYKDIYGANKAVVKEFVVVEK